MKRILKTKKEQIKGLNDKSLNEAVFPLLDKNPFRKFVPLKDEAILVKDATGQVRELSKKTGPITTYGEVTEFRMGGENKQSYQEYKKGGELPKLQWGHNLQTDNTNFGQNLNLRTNNNYGNDYYKDYDEKQQSQTRLANIAKYGQDQSAGYSQPFHKTESYTYNPYLPYIGIGNYALNSLANLNRSRQGLQNQETNMRLTQSDPGVVYLNDRQQRGDNQMFAENGGQLPQFQLGGSNLPFMNLSQKNFAPAESTAVRNMNPLSLNNPGLQSTEESDVTDFKSKIAGIESKTDGYKAQNPNSSAVGKYQFLWKSHGESIKKFTGVKSKEDFKNNPEAQETFMDNWIKTTLTPQAQSLQKLTSKYTIDQLKALIHFKGLAGAKTYIKSGKDNTSKNNTSISNYLSKFEKGGQYEGQELELTEEQYNYYISQGYEFE